MKEKSSNNSEKNNNGWWFNFFWLAVFIVGLAAASGYFDAVRLAMPFLLLFIFLFVSEEYGLYSLALFLPMINWNFYYGNLEIPLIDLIGLAVFTAFILRKVYQRLFLREKFILRLPLLIPFVFFLASAFISCFFASYLKDSFWYFARWILFFYFVYVVFPVNAANREEVLRKSIVSLVIGGVITAAMGMLSVFTQDWSYQFVRVLPLSFGGIYPWGENQNLIAEVLIVSSVLTQALKNWTKSESAHRWYDLLTIFQVAVLLGTFSRAAWIALVAQIFIWLVFYAKRLPRATWAVLLGLFIVLSPLFLYMYKLQSEFSIGGSSTENRLLMTEIAWEKFLDKPVFGQGSGTFINFIGDDIRFTAKYGPPLDAHGFLQKIILENGIFGIFTFLILLWSFFTIVFRALKKRISKYPWLLPLVLSSVGVVIMELFNTSYYKGKLWLPIALCLAALNIIRHKESSGGHFSKDKLS